MHSRRIVKLGLIQATVDAAQFHQFAVSSFLDDTSILNHEYLISILYRRKAMSNDDARTTLASLVQCLLNNL